MQVESRYVKMFQPLLKALEQDWRRIGRGKNLNTSKWMSQLLPPLFFNGE
jgi:hypothetical protein